MKINDTQFDPAIDPREREYNLSGKIRVVKKYAKQGFFSKREEAKAVCIELSQSDETTKFFAAWLPEDEKHTSEVLAEMGHPIYGSCRMAVLRESSLYPKGPHLFIMHKWAEEILLKKDGDLIYFKTKRGLEDAQDKHESDSRDISESEVARL